MPTGYTADVGEGTVTEFDDFVWRCARGMGALIMMRDEPMSAPIPERFEASTKYHDERLAAAIARLAELQAMEPAQVREAALQAHARAYASWNSYRVEKKQKRGRYEAMLARVNAWTPPTDNHVGLQSFMRQQLEESIRFDCDYEAPAPVSPGPDAWHAQEIEQAERDIARNTKYRAEEIERTEGCNRWLADLRKSLA